MILSAWTTVDYLSHYHHCCQLSAGVLIITTESVLHYPSPCCLINFPRSVSPTITRQVTVINHELRNCQPLCYYVIIININQLSLSSLSIIIIINVIYHYYYLWLVSDNIIITILWYIITNTVLVSWWLLQQCYYAVVSHMQRWLLGCDADMSRPRSRSLWGICVCQELSPQLRLDVIDVHLYR